MNKSVCDPRDQFRIKQKLNIKFQTLTRTKQDSGPSAHWAACGCKTLSTEIDLEVIQILILLFSFFLIR